MKIVHFSILVRSNHSISAEEQEPTQTSKCTRESRCNCHWLVCRQWTRGELCRVCRRSWEVSMCFWASLDLDLPLTSTSNNSSPTHCLPQPANPASNSVLTCKKYLHFRTVGSSWEALSLKCWLNSQRWPVTTSLLRQRHFSANLKHLWFKMS